MLPKIEYIKQTRTKFGLTQRELASLTGISTSMINQIESGRCKPSYDTARKIFEVLNSHEGNTSMKVGDICSSRVIYVESVDTVHIAIQKMRNNSISQVPVFEGTKVVGILSEDTLARSLMERDDQDLHKLSISKIMGPPPPIVDISTPAKAIIPLVRFTKCVLVSERGEVMGIVTVTDTLKMVE